MRFQFIHAADLHIDSPLAALGAKDAAVAATFAAASRKAVERLITETIDTGAKFLVVAGDVFDGDWRDVSTGLFFVRELGGPADVHCQGQPRRGKRDFALACLSAERARI
jgi:DNA repair protein SbcD/Mre11